jgi:ferritin-like metal-binding protein YciE
LWKIFHKPAFKTASRVWDDILLRLVQSKQAGENDGRRLRSSQYMSRYKTIIHKTVQESMSRNDMQPELQHDKSRIQLFEGLAKAYTADRALIKALPVFAKASVSTELTATFDLYAAQTEEHIAALRKIFKMLGERPVQTTTPMKHLVQQVQMTLDRHSADPVRRELGLIIKTKEIEACQIFLYSSIYNAAQTCGYTEIARIIKTAVCHETERLSVLAKLESSFLSAWPTVRKLTNR